VEGQKNPKRKKMFGAYAMGKDEMCDGSGGDDDDVCFSGSSDAPSYAVPTASLSAAASALDYSPAVSSLSTANATAAFVALAANNSADKSPSKGRDCEPRELGFFTFACGERRISLWAGEREYLVRIAALVPGVAAVQFFTDRDFNVAVKHPPLGFELFSHREGEWRRTPADCHGKFLLVHTDPYELRYLGSPVLSSGNAHAVFLRGLGESRAKFLP
jgi:hypothetical protein